MSLDAALKQILAKLGLKHVVQDEVILITADVPANPRPTKPPADDPELTRFKMHPAERELIDRLENLGARCSLCEDGRVWSICFDSVAEGDEVLAIAGQLHGTARTGFLHGSRIAVSCNAQSKLTDLELHGEKITDKGLASLAGLTQLRRLDLANTDVTDAGLKHLEKFASLRDLSLSGTRVDGSGLAAISTLDLVTLDLDKTQATDACLAHVGRFPHLLMLQLSRTEINGSGLQSLAALKSPVCLDLSGTRIADGAMVHLRSVEKLETLILDETGITDLGLASLRDLPKLRLVSANKTRVTKEALAEFNHNLAARWRAEAERKEAPKSPDDPFGP